MNLLELRSNPNINKKHTGLEQLAKYKDREGVYVSYTSVDKLGINPKSSFTTTPLAIYVYPLKQMWNKLSKQNSGEFAADRPYVWVVEHAKGISFDINDMTVPNFKAIKSQLFNKYFSTGVHAVQIKQLASSMKMDLSKQQHLDRVFHEYIVDQSFVAHDEDSAHDATAMELTDNIEMGFQGALLWAITKIAAKTAGGRHAVRWNAILREVGVGLITDTSGKGIIHPNEPTQGLFMDVRSLRVLERIQQSF